MDKLPLPPIRTTLNQNFFNALLLHLKPQPLAERRKILYAFLILVEKNYHNQSNTSPVIEPIYGVWHMSKLTTEGRKNLRNFFVEPVSKKLYRFETIDFPFLIHFFELMWERRAIIFNSDEISNYNQTLQKNLATDFIND